MNSQSRRNKRHDSNQPVDVYSKRLSPKSDSPKMAKEKDITTTQPVVLVKTVMFCSTCMAGFDSIQQVQDHMVKDHDYKPPEVNKDTCLEDDVTSEKITSDNSEDEDEKLTLKEVRKRLKLGFVHSCSFKLCPYKFESVEKREQHELCHVSKNDDKVREFLCSFCQAEFHNWRVCSAHIWKQHKLDIDMLRCFHCTFRATLPVKVYRHIVTHGQLHGKRFICNVCSKSFGRYDQLASHKEIHAAGKTATTGRWYSQKKCELCDNNFSNAKTLSKHVKTVHNKIKPFICNVCNYKSARKATWQIHMRQHTGERPLKCKSCDYRAADPSALRKHEAKHSKSKQYECPSCDDSFIQSIALKVHLKTSHPDEYAKMICDQCSFVSINRQRLERHKKDHRTGLFVGLTSSLNKLNNEEAANTPKMLPPQKACIEISSDCFLPLESTDSIAHDSALDTGGVTIPAPTDDTQFPTFMTP